jgi:hypothetical protein
MAMASIINNGGSRNGVMAINNGMKMAISISIMASIINNVMKSIINGINNGAIMAAMAKMAG